MNQIMGERLYLEELLESITYDNNLFEIYWSENKVVFGMMMPDKNDILNKSFMYKSIFSSVKDLNNKIKYSLKTSIESAYSDEVINGQFNFFEEPTGKEWSAYYFLENAIFRISTLWDLLAQIYNIKYDIIQDIKRVNYFKFFNEKIKIDNIKTIDKEQVIKIKSYLNELDNRDLDGIWEGNHKHVNEYRSKMTHRNAPSISIISSYDINLKSHPHFELKRTVEDYYIVSKFILEFINNLEMEF